MTGIITTSRQDPGLISKALRLSTELTVPFVARNDRSLEKLRQLYGADCVLVVEQERLVLKSAASELFWHPNMALPRIKALSQGQPDTMTEALALQPGYSVLDCTLGLAADALVSAFVVGKEGSVTGLEINKYIAVLAKYGISAYMNKGRSARLREAAGRIRVVNEGYEEYLRKLPQDSFDVVYFDPMFSYGLQRSSGINALRAFADHRPLTETALELALRAARHRVALKQSAKSPDLALLKPHDILGGRYSSVVYGVWKK